jgi:hypothetical protein
MTWRSRALGSSVVFGLLVALSGLVGIQPAGATKAQSITYSGVVTIPVPPASNFAGASGGGDGWGTAETSTQVFNVFHHEDSLNVACHNQSDAKPCWGTTVFKTITDPANPNTGTNGFASQGEPGLYIDQASGHLFVFATRQADDTAGVVCIDTTAPAATADPFCGFTALSAVGQGQIGGNSYIGNPMQVGSKWYAFNYYSEVVPTGTEDTLMCFDLTTFGACAGQPFAVNTGPSGTVSVSDFPPPSSAAIGTQLIIPIDVAGKGLLSCYDTTTGANCSGSWPVDVSADGYVGSYGAPFPLLSAAGAVTGLCLPSFGSPCFSLAGASVATPPGMAAAMSGESPWNSPAFVLGPRVYIAAGNTNAVDCYDASTQAACTYVGAAGSYPKALTNLEYLYTVNADPQRPTCIWVNADGGSDQIQNFDAYTGGPCGAGDIRVLASSIVVNSTACIPANYTSLQVLQPARNTYTSGSVTFEDSDAVQIPGTTVEPLDANGAVDLTPLNLSTKVALPQFLINLAGAPAQTSSVEVQLTWTGNYDPSCLAQGASGQAPQTGVPGHSAIGYRMQGQDGGVFDYGNSQFYGSLAPYNLSSPIIATANTYDNGGYWMVGLDGAVYAFGDAPYLGGMNGQPLNDPIVGIAGTPTQKGYWLISADGGVFAFGDAKFYGGLADQSLNAPILSVMPTPSGHGYWLVSTDGGVFSFGDATFHGSMVGQNLNAPILAAWPSVTGGGYLLSSADGGVFAFGDASFHGSAVNLNLNAPIVGIVGDPSGGGYWLMGEDGGIFAFGNAPYFGSMASQVLTAPITSAST